MQETMWSNSFRRKEQITCVSSGFILSMHSHKCTRTHTQTYTLTRQSTPPSPGPPEHRKPSVAEVPAAFGPQGHLHGCRHHMAGVGAHHGHRPCDTHTHHGGVEAKPSHLLPRALHDFDGNGIDLVVHFHRSLFPTTDFHQQDAEIRSSKIQGQEVTMLCRSQEQKESQKQPSASWQPVTLGLEAFKGKTPVLNKGEEL